MMVLVLVKWLLELEPTSEVESISTLKVLTLITQLVLITQFLPETHLSTPPLALKR